MKLTITEALAEIKTIDKRIGKKQESILPYLWRQEQLRDPHEKDGGSVAFIQKELQAIGDLGVRKMALRRAIQRANDTTRFSINGTENSISDWLTWRREVAPGKQTFSKQMASHIHQARAQAQAKGFAVVGAGAVPSQPSDLLVNINEQELAAEMENLETVLGSLDGQLSLKNATVLVEVE